MNNQIGQTDAQGAHTHALGINPAGAHTHQTDAQGYHGHNVSVQAHTHGIISDGNHAHNVNLGGGGNPFEVMVPDSRGHQDHLLWPTSFHAHRPRCRLRRTFGHGLH